MKSFGIQDTANEKNGPEEEQGENVQAIDSELKKLRELLQKKKEIRDLCRQLAELETENGDASSTRNFVHFKGVEESMQIFSGDDNIQIKTWIWQFEEMADVLKWDEKFNFIYANRLLTPTAKLLLRTVFVRSWPELKSALLKEFNQKVTTADAYNELRNRKKNREIVNNTL